jgi:spermidine/putrescine ABC transporter ATP-binding subunit
MGGHVGEPYLAGWRAAVVSGVSSTPRNRQIKGAEVRLEGLVKTFGPVRAVDGVTLTVRAGEFLTLLGPSGSGKTTTLACIAGFAVPTEGDVLIQGRVVTFEPPFKRNVGMVFQNYALFPHMTVAQNLAFPLRMRKLPAAVARERVAGVLALVQLEGLEGRYPRQLSGGQQQRVALARALVFEPPVLLMDEPLGALDKKLRTDMQLELKHLQARLGVTVIYVTHDQEEALTLSDRIAVMNRGRIEQLGEPLEVYETPRTRFVAEFIGESNLVEGTVAPAAGGGLVLVTRAGLCLPIRPGSARAGEAATVLLRPEKIAIAVEGGPGDAPIVDGEVAEAIYLGETVRYVVRAAGGQRLTIKQPNLAPSGALKVGTRVGLRWDPDAAVAQRPGETGQ